MTMIIGAKRKPFDANPFEWRLLSEKAGKKTFHKIDRATMEHVVMEIEETEFSLAEARAERERPQLVGPDMKPIAVIPPSVEAQAMREGWYNDKDQWRKWANDSDNRNLRTSDGTA
jgi:hypothetical protein